MARPKKNPLEKVEIYGLYDPDTGALRYVGKANNAANRLRFKMRIRAAGWPTILGSWHNSNA